MGKIELWGLCAKCGGAVTKDARGNITCEECEREDEFEKAQRIDKDETEGEI